MLADYIVWLPSCELFWHAYLQQMRNTRTYEVQLRVSIQKSVCLSMIYYDAFLLQRRSCYHFLLTFHRKLEFSVTLKRIYSLILSAALDLSRPRKKEGE